jgi:hypothetical protein
LDGVDVAALDDAGLTLGEVDDLVTGGRVAAVIPDVAVVLEGFAYDLTHYVNNVNITFTEVLAAYGAGGQLAADHTYGTGAALQAYRSTTQYIQQRTAEIKQRVIEFHCSAAARLSDAWENTVKPWVQDNWEYVVGGAMVIGGGVLMATGVGGPAGLALISAGADTLMQKAVTGEVDWGQVALSGALGALGAGAGIGVAARVGATAVKE